MNEREQIRWKLSVNHLTNVWLVNQLEKRGVNIDKTVLVGAMNGSRKGPQVDTVIRVSLEILNDYEKAMGQKPT